MMKHIKWSISALLCGWLGVSTAFPCTTFVLEGNGHIYFGRNFDWFSEDGLVIINQRNIRKTAFVTPGNTPAQWTSQYGSVTFNAVGQKMPCGGMNEAGLVVENMWLDQSKCPAADSRPAVNVLEWIQYQLDNCRTVAEVVATDERLRIDPLAMPARAHYLVCDAGGDCASIEFLDGKMVCHRGDNLPCRALANDPYDASAAYLKAHPEPEGDVRTLRAAYRKQKVDGRFAHAATRAARFTAGTMRQDLDYAFETLDDVCQGSYTVWRLVYDVSNRRIHYRTRSHPQERTLDLNSMDFARGLPVQFFNLRPRTADSLRFQSALPAAAPDFQDLSETRHRRYAEGYLSQAWVKRGFGCMTPLMEAMLLHLRTDTCDGSGAIVNTPQPGALEGSPSGEEIMRKALAARGGREAASRLQSLHSRGTADLSWQKNKHLPLETITSRSNKLLVTVESKPVSPSGHYEYGYDGQRGWEKPFGAGLKLLEGKALDECREAAEFSLGEPEDYHSMHYLSETTFDGRKCWALKVVRNSGNEEINYYDAASYLLAGTVEHSAAAETWVVTTYRDYQAVGGFKFPTRIDCRRRWNHFVIRLSSIEVNTVEDSAFKMPSGSRANYNSASKR
jgi:penicillin V acylase-like amidase (Ntn superfamily)